MLLVRTSLKGDTNAPGPQEHKLRTAQKKTCNKKNAFELRYDLISSLEGYVGSSNIQL